MLMFVADHANSSTSSRARCPRPRSKRLRAQRQPAPTTRNTIRSLLRLWYVLNILSTLSQKLYFYSHFITVIYLLYPVLIHFTYLLPARRKHGHHRRPARLPVRGRRGDERAQHLRRQVSARPHCVHCALRQDARELPGTVVRAQRGLAVHDVYLHRAAGCGRESFGLGLVIKCTSFLLLFYMVVT